MATQKLWVVACGQADKKYEKILCIPLEKGQIVLALENLPFVTTDTFKIIHTGKVCRASCIPFKKLNYESVKVDIRF